MGGGGQKIAPPAHICRSFFLMGQKNISFEGLGRKVKVNGNEVAYKKKTTYITFSAFIGKKYVYCEQMDNSVSALWDKPHFSGCPTNEAFILYQHRLYSSSPPVERNGMLQPAIIDHSVIVTTWVFALLLGVSEYKCGLCGITIDSETEINDSYSNSYSIDLLQFPVG